MQDESKERIINVKTKTQDKTFKIRFATANQYSKAYDTLLNKPPNKQEGLLSLDSLNYKFDIQYDNILFFYYPDNDINWIDNNMMKLSIIFEDKEQLDLLIVGPKRAKNAYGIIKILLEKNPTNFFVNLPQDEYKFALVKHYCSIKEIYLYECKTKPELENING